MASVYSVQFAALQGLNGTHTLTVPAGFKAVLRDLDAYNGGGASSTDLFLIGSAGQTIFNDSSALQPKNSQWRGRQVLEELETWALRTTGAWDVTVSGYLLTLP